MRYSKKQYIFAVFMLNRIGITDSKDIEIYLSHLSTLYGKMVQFPSSWKFSVSECIDLLKEEIEVKKGKGLIKNRVPQQTITATDLANYDYCPASYAINNSFVIENPSGEEFTEIGKLLHEQLLLARGSWHTQSTRDYSSSDLNDQIIRDSTLIFAGHQDDNKIFRNDDWAGTPDYIFQDTAKKYFVVEEKFHKRRDPAKASSDEVFNDRYGISHDDEFAIEERKDWSNYKGFFFSNHIVQITSYIKNIKDYPIDYGHLIYWYYDFDSNNIPYIHKMVAKQINLDPSTEALYSNALNGIINLRNSPDATFPAHSLNMKKCAGCVVNKYCGHKTKRYPHLAFPYPTEYINLYFTPFPEESRKTET